MTYLIKKNQSSYPILVKSVDLFFEKHRNYRGSIQVVIEPENRDVIEEGLNNPDLLPDIQVVVDWYMENFTGIMIHPGCAMVQRGLMDCDPPEPPEFDLPDEDDYKFSVRENWANDFLENVGFSNKYLTIDSLKLSNDDRNAILDKCDELYEEEFGHWPDNNELIERYAVTEPYEY